MSSRVLRSQTANSKTHVSYTPSKKARPPRKAKVMLGETLTDDNSPPVEEDNSPSLEEDNSPPVQDRPPRKSPARTDITMKALGTKLKQRQKLTEKDFEFLPAYIARQTEFSGYIKYLLLLVLELREEAKQEREALFDKCIESNVWRDFWLEDPITVPDLANRILCYSFQLDDINDIKSRLYIAYCQKFLDSDERALGTKIVSTQGIHTKSNDSTYHTRLIQKQVDHTLKCIINERELDENLEKGQESLSDIINRRVTDVRYLNESELLQFYEDFPIMVASIRTSKNRKPTLGMCLLLTHYWVVAFNVLKYEDRKTEDYEGMRRRLLNRWFYYTLNDSFPAIELMWDWRTLPIFQWITTFKNPESVDKENRKYDSSTGEKRKRSNSVSAERKRRGVIINADSDYDMPQVADTFPDYENQEVGREASLDNRLDGTSVDRESVNRASVEDGMEGIEQLAGDSQRPRSPGKDPERTGSSAEDSGLSAEHAEDTRHAEWKKPDSKTKKSLLKIRKMAEEIIALLYSPSGHDDFQMRRIGLHLRQALDTTNNLKTEVDWRKNFPRLPAGRQVIALTGHAFQPQAVREIQMIEEQVQLARKQLKMTFG